MTQIALLRFPITQALYNQWASQHPESFELRNSSPFSAHLLLYVTPEEYKPVEQELGENNITPGFAGVQVMVANRLFGFEITTVEATAAPYETLKQLARTAAATPGNYSPITVLDGAYIDPNDTPNTQTVDGITFTRRRMRLMNLTPQGGTLVQGNTRYGVGFTLRMMELTPREFY